MGVWAKVPRIATELKRWIRTDRRWKRKALSRLSLETWVMRLPMSLTNLSPAIIIIIITGIILIILYYATEAAHTQYNHTQQIIENNITKSSS